MIKSFAKYSCVALSLVVITTSVSHATFFLNKGHDEHKDKPKISIFEPVKKIIDIKKSIIPEYIHTSMPHTPTHNNPHTPTPHTPTPHTPSTSISEPFALLAMLTAMSAFLYRRRQNSF